MRFIKTTSEIKIRENVVISKGAVAREVQGRIHFRSEDVTGLPEGALPVYEGVRPDWPVKIFELDVENIINQFEEALRG